MAPETAEAAPLVNVIRLVWVCVLPDGLPSVMACLAYQVLTAELTSVPPRPDVSETDGSTV